MGEFVRVEIDQAIATIRLERPPMNALNAQVQAEIAAAAAAVSDDQQVRAVVMYGGEKVFAAGADIKEMAGASYAAMAQDSRRLQDSFTAVARIGKPVVAAITGYALGGGLELALCADFRVAGEGARVGQPEILLGLIPGRRRHPAAAQADRPGQGQGHRLHGPVRRRGRGARDRAGRQGRARRRGVPGGASTWSAGSPAGRPSRCGPPSRRLTRAWTLTSTPAWRSSGSSSPACSRRRMRGRACAASWRMDQGRHRSPDGRTARGQPGVPLRPGLAVRRRTEGRRAAARQSRTERR